VAEEEFLSVVSAACDEQGIRIGDAERAQELSEDATVVRRVGARIKFDAPCEMKPVCRDSELFPARDLVRIRHADPVEELEERGAPTAPAEESGGRPGRESRVDEGDGDVALPSFGEKNRPEFAFNEEQALGLKKVEDFADNGSEVDRIVKNEEVRICALKGAGESCGGGYREGDGKAGLLSAQGADEFERQQSFTNADGMDPRPAFGCEEMALVWSEEAEALAKVLAPSASAEESTQDPREEERRENRPERAIEAKWSLNVLG
jgi:hypothetical protein